MSVGPQPEPITRDAIVVLSAPADPSHRIAGVLSPFDPAAASAVLGAAAKLPAEAPAPIHAAASALLDGLLAPLGRARFFAEHWERAPVLLRDGSDTPRLRFDRDDLERGIAAGTWAPSSVSLSRAGIPVDTAAYTRMLEQGGRTRTVLDPEQLTALLADEGSIRVLELQAFDVRIAALARELGSTLHCRIGVNMYASSPGQGHFSGVREGIHWDTHGVLAVQTRGRKRWSVYPPLIEQPLPQHRSYYFDIPRSEALIDAVLEPGDVLYIPRGFVHQVRSPAESDSIHLAIGMHVPSWAELVEVLLRRAQLERGHLPSWRAALDPTTPIDSTRVAGMLAELTASIAALDADALLEDAMIGGQALAPEPPGPRPRLHAGTRLHRRPVLFYLREEAGHAVLKLPARKILFPLRAMPVLQRLAGDDGCELAELARMLSPSEAGLVAELLLFHGFLEVSEAP